MVMDGAVPARGSWKTRPIDAAAHVLGLPGHIAAAEHDRAGGDREGAGHGVEQRRLAGAVGADDA